MGIHGCVIDSSSTQYIEWVEEVREKDCNTKMDWIVGGHKERSRRFILCPE